MLPYFKKFEGLDDDEILNDPELAAYRNADGPIKISKSEYPAILEEKQNVLISAFGEAGIKEVIDHNGPDQMGIARCFYTISKPEPDSIRYSSAQAYLLQGQTNLYILKNAFATRLIIEDNVAQGVEVLVNGETSQFYASKEVIVSAGAVGSTKLLIASGIGASEDLANLDIDVVADLPVGYNLADHVAVSMVLAGHSDLETNLETREPYLTVNGLSYPTSFAFYSTEGSELPDIQFSTSVFGVSSPFYFSVCDAQAGLGIKLEICQHTTEANLIHEFFYIDSILEHPKSLGQVIVNSVDPDVSPILDLNYFSDEDDLATLRAGIRFAAGLIETSYFKDNGFVVDFGLPNCPAFDLESDDYLDCYIKSLSHSLFHFSGTTAMGQVVDSDLKVYGVDSLRIADAGVIPAIPAANIFAAVAMIAEKISDVIKVEYGYAV